MAIGQGVKLVILFLLVLLVMWLLIETIDVSGVEPAFQVPGSGERSFCMDGIAD
jgi:hypothetical protein